MRMNPFDGGPSTSGPSTSGGATGGGGKPPPQGFDPSKVAGHYVDEDDDDLSVVAKVKSLRKSVSTAKTRLKHERNPAKILKRQARVRETETLRDEYLSKHSAVMAERAASMTAARLARLSERNRIHIETLAAQAS